MDFHKTVRVGAGPFGSVFCKIEFIDGRLSISGVEGPKRNGDCQGACGQIDMHPWNLATYAPGWSAELEARFRDVWRRWHLNDMRAGCKHQRGPEWEPRDVEWTTCTVEWDARRKLEREAEAESRALFDKDMVKGNLEALARVSVPATLLLVLHTLKLEPFTWRVVNVDATPTVAKLLRRPEEKQAFSDFIASGGIKTRTERKSTGWLRYTEHPDGLLSKPCDVCGYHYGSAWQREEVPADVLDFLRALPDTDMTPAWV